MYLEACHSVWNSLVTQANHHGASFLCTMGDLDTCCLVFLSVSATWTGYFLMNGTILHLRVKVKCMHHTEQDWLELWKGWWLVVKCMLDWWIFVYNYGICYCFLIIMVIWCLLISFIINSPLQFCSVCLVPVMIANLRLWEQMYNNRWHGERFFLWESPSRHDDVEIILEKSCILLSTPS